ncbi:MAG: DUF962 domain-containing protein [Alphaproteobacteria bacterium]
MSDNPARSGRTEWFDQQFRTYGEYHKDERNRMTHLVGIPMIMQGILMALAVVYVGPVSLALPVVIAASAAWLYWDRALGRIMLLPVITMFLIALNLPKLVGLTGALVAAGLFFGIGWVLQIWGHKMEGKKPAFVDNVVQLMIGPMFILDEALQMMRGKDSTD